MSKPTTLVKSLDELESHNTRKNLLTDAEAEAIIKATRRGVPVTAIEATQGVAHGTAYTRLGRWALYRCHCFAPASK